LPHREEAVMRSGFETLGNATLVFYDEGHPLLATDPWLQGTCYFGSWGLDRPLTAAEREAVERAPFVWISHGHPDHLHLDSLAALSRGTRILLPDHYDGEIAATVRSHGFAVDIMPYRQWRQLSPRVRCLCLDNENQDAVLVVEVGDALIVNLNDSPLFGEGRFLRKLVAGYDRNRTYLASLCAIDADMLNFVDAQGRRVTEPPEHYKPGAVWSVARLADRLGVGNYVCSSSQHLYLRADSVWANPYRVTWADIERHWTRPAIRVLEPFVRVNLDTGAVERKHPAQTSDFSQVTDGAGADDYAERLSETEWQKVSEFFRKFQTIRRFVDYVEFMVGGERRRIWFNLKAEKKSERRLKGIVFHAPRRSLCEAVEYGYFDDLLIGNFMKTELRNVRLYPHFTPLICKLGGNAKVYTDAEWRRYRRRYFRRNPWGYAEWRLRGAAERLIDFFRRISGRWGFKTPLKWVYRKMLGDPVAWR
jgi:hypothetical protein